jgi:hypothetical protein
MWFEGALESVSAYYFARHQSASDARITDELLNEDPTLYSC